MVNRIAEDTLQANQPFHQIISMPLKKAMGMKQGRSWNETRTQLVWSVAHDERPGNFDTDANSNCVLVSVPNRLPLALAAGANRWRRKRLELGKANEQKDRDAQIRDAFSVAFPTIHETTPNLGED